jgi:hypothetical protein
MNHGLGRNGAATRPRWMHRHTAVNVTLVAALLLFVVWATFAR